MLWFEIFTAVFTEDSRLMRADGELLDNRELSGVWTSSVCAKCSCVLYTKLKLSTGEPLDHREHRDLCDELPLVHSSHRRSTPQPRPIISSWLLGWASCTVVSDVSIWGGALEPVFWMGD